MSRRKALARARRWANHLNYVEALGAHAVSWTCLRAMDHPAVGEAWGAMRRH